MATCVGGADSAGLESMKNAVAFVDFFTVVRGLLICTSARTFDLAIAGTAAWVLSGAPSVSGRMLNDILPETPPRTQTSLARSTKKYAKSEETFTVILALESRTDTPCGTAFRNKNLASITHKHTCYTSFSGFGHALRFARYFPSWHRQPVPCIIFSTVDIYFLLAVWHTTQRHVSSECL